MSKTKSLRATNRYSLADITRWNALPHYSDPVDNCLDEIYWQLTFESDRSPEFIAEVTARIAAEWAKDAGAVLLPCVQAQLCTITWEVVGYKHFEPEEPLPEPQHEELFRIVYRRVFGGSPNEEHLCAFATAYREEAYAQWPDQEDLLDEAQAASEREYERRMDG